MPGRLEQKIENRRSLFGLFKDLTPIDLLQLSLPLIQSVRASPVGAAVVQATMQSIARPPYLPTGPNRFPVLPNQGIPKPSAIMLIQIILLVFQTIFKSTVFKRLTEIVALVEDKLILN